MGKRLFLLFTTLVLLLGIAACQGNPTQTLAADVVETRLTSTPFVEPTTALPTPTFAPPRSLVICLGKEPASLYLYGNLSRSAWSVLEAVYDGPFDTVDGVPQPVIVQKTPSYLDGDAFYRMVDVQKGDLVIDLSGNLVALQAGVQVQPAGCKSNDCALSWDGENALQMDQLVLQYHLLPGITWSDGVKLSAQDSVYSFQISSDRSTPASRQSVQRTASYQALNDETVEWVGLPGFFPQDLSDYFWIPLPEHALNHLSASDLITNELASRYPLGWGAYIIEEWVSGDHITLKKNPSYFRAAEGLPVFDNLVFRFLGEPEDSLLTALLSKECDVIDQSTLLEEQLSDVLQQQAEGTLTAYISTGPEWEHLGFGIQPASYDDGYSAYYGDRADFFSDVRTRQAFAYCIDRQGIIDELLAGQTSIPLSIGLLAGTADEMGDLVSYEHDPEKGRQLLDQVGWKEWDGDPETPLQAIGIPNIPDGTYFQVQYYTSEAQLRADVAHKIQSSLKTCGVEVQVNLMPVDELYAAGPGGVLFGRNFDLAQFSWSAGDNAPCLFYASEQIPGVSNNWLTLNLWGYSNPEYDAACLAARTTRPDQADVFQTSQANVQRVFTEELPVIPLFYRMRVAISRPDFCGMSLDVSTRSTFWNLEAFDYGDTCR